METFDRDTPLIWEDVLSYKFEDGFIIIVKDGVTFYENVDLIKSFIVSGQ